MTECQHRDFLANVEVSRIQDGETMLFVAELAMQCADCGTEFVFSGLPRELNAYEPTTGPVGTPARLPIRPMNEQDKKPAAYRVVMKPEGSGRL